LRERAADRARVVFDEALPRDDDEEDRARGVLRELEVFREFDVLRAFDGFFVLLLLEPFLDVDLERLDVLRRRLVLAFACAI
jgi:hypothetical protein